MWNEPTKPQLAKLPRLYQTEDIPLKDKQIHLHFFIGGCDWYVAEYDGEDLFWGYAILNSDFEMAEWGYISFQELKELKIPPGFEIDCEKDWNVKRAVEIEKIRMGNNWPETKDRKDHLFGKEEGDDTRTGYSYRRDH